VTSIRTTPTTATTTTTTTHRTTRLPFFILPVLPPKPAVVGQIDERTKPGECAFVPADNSVGNCVTLCNSDYECVADLKCMFVCVRVFVYIKCFFRLRNRMWSRMQNTWR
jgi:hypothetical protein